MRCDTTKAIHLTQGSVSLDIIRDSLGHVVTKTTEIYARANLEMKRAAIEKVSPAPIPSIPSWKENKSLRNICNVYSGACV
jgi:integrase/recombinase XerD